MAKVLLAKGARGELVRKIQVALTDQGQLTAAFEGHGFTLAQGNFRRDR